MRYIYANGQPFPDGFCAMPDHYMVPVTVYVKALRPVGANEIKALVEGKFEVLEAVAGEPVCVVKNSPNPPKLVTS